MSKNLRRFGTTSQYDAYTADTANFILPNVSFINETNTVEYNPDTVTPITDAVITCDSATYNGQTQVATNIVVTLSGNTLISGTDYTVSGNEGGINAGDYTFTVNGIGNYSGSKNGTFTINKASRTMSWVSNPSDVTSGSSITVEAAPSLGVGDGTITYSSSDTTKATVNGNIVSGVGVGSCIITATISEGTNCLQASTSYSLTVKEYRVVAKFNVTDTSSPTQIISEDAWELPFSAIEIDGVAQPSVVSAYTFTTTGEHTVKYTLTGPTSINDNAFRECPSLTSINIPNSVTSIGMQAFWGCTSLTSINIPSSVTSIGMSAFNSCISLTSIEIPSSVTSIGAYAFDGTPWWNTYSADTSHSYGNIIYINDIAYKATSENITSATFRNGTISISHGAFEACGSLTNIDIPNSVISIGDGAFVICSGLTSCTIGSGVTSINTQAFYGCSSLTSIVSNAMTAPTIDSDTFQGIKTGGTLTVPSSSTGYDVWMGTGNYYLGKYGWTKVEQ